MSKIGIFSPIYHRNKEVQKFLVNLTYSNFSQHETYLSLGINGADRGLGYFVRAYAEAVADRFKQVLVFDPESNIGKPALVNSMVKALESSTGINLDYIVSIDSDMVTVDFNWMNKLVEVFESFEAPNPDVPKTLGAVCANQSGSDCHVLDKDPVKYVAGEYEVITRAGNEGVAGGVLMTPGHIWHRLGGYCAHRIYASDDGHYALSCTQKGYIMGMVPQVTFYHPPAVDPGYSDWKHRAVRDMLTDDEKPGYKF